MLRRLERLRSYRAAVDQHAIVAVTDPAGTITFANDLFCRISGYAREELIGRNHRLLNSGVHPKSFWTEMWRTIVRGDVWHGEVCNRAKDGTRYWVKTTIVPVRDSFGRLVEIVALRSDITDQVRVHETLLEQARALTRADRTTRALAAAVEAAGDAIFTTDADGRITYVNAAFEAASGWTREAIVGQQPSVLRDAATDAAVYAELWRTIAAGRTWQGRLRNRRRGAVALPVVNQAPPREDDLHYWVETTITPMRDDATQRITGYVAVQHDVTDLVRQEISDALAREGAEAEARIAAILASELPLARRLERALERLFEMKHLQVQSKGGVFALPAGAESLRMFAHVGAFSDAFLRDEAEVPLGRCLCGRAAISGELVVSDDCFEDDRHENRWPNMVVHGHYVVPLMHAGGCEGVLFLYTDPNPSRDSARLLSLQRIGDMMALAFVRERTARLLVDAREKAEHAAASKSSFLANMSHEIRTPLTAILGYADLLHDDDALAQDPVRRRETVDTIRRAGSHLLTIINDILDLSKIEAGRLGVEAIETPILELLGEVESFLRPRAEGKGVALETRIESPLPERILSDPTRVRQILMNLVGNAVKFTEAGRVLVRARRGTRSDGAALVLEIEDTGSGLTTEQASRLFQPFAQADETVTRRHGGTGLGLVICRRLAELLGGGLTLVHTAPGAGSCFRVELPLRAVAGAPLRTEIRMASTDAPSTAPDAPALRGRILLAEDGPDNQRLIAHHLRKAGATIDVADHGRIALEMIERAAADGAPYALLLTDIQMPEMDGYTLTRTLRERGVAMPIVALTAHAMAEDRQRCAEAGCDGYLSKPIDRGALLATCAEMLARTRASASPRVATAPIDATRSDGRAMRGAASSRKEGRDADGDPVVA